MEKLYYLCSENKGVDQSAVTAQQTVPLFSPMQYLGFLTMLFMLILQYKSRLTNL